MNLFEARLKMAGLITKAANFHKQYISGSSTPKDEHYTEYKALSKAIEDFGYELASYPFIRGNLECWIVSINGSGFLSDSDVKALLKGADVSTVIDSMAMLAEKIKLDIETNGWTLDHNHASADGWCLGITCTESESNALCDFLHSKYATEIAAQIISIKKKFLGFRFKDLKNWSEAEAFLSNSAN